MTAIITRYCASRLSIPKEAINIISLYPEYITELGKASFGFKYTIQDTKNSNPSNIFENIILGNSDYKPYNIYSISDMQSIFKEKFINQDENKDEDEYEYIKNEINIKKEIEFRTRMKMYEEETKNLGYYTEKDYEHDDWLEEEISIFDMKKNMSLAELMGEVDMNGETTYSDMSEEEY